MALPPGQPGGVGLGMMKQSGSAGTPSGHLVHQLPVHHQPGPGLQGPGLQGMFSSWPRYAGPPMLPGLAAAGFPPRFNGGGGGSPPGSGAGRHGDSLSRTNLYIRGLSPHTTDKDLINLCQKFGPIISTKAILDKATNRCKGYGFVDFESPTSALAAVNELQGQGIQAQMARQAEQDPTNLYIANLPHTVKESDLEQMFSPYGQVISTRILRDSNQQSRGVGFARMESREKCEQIISYFNNRPLAGSGPGSGPGGQPLVVKFADGGTSRRKTAVSSPDPTWSGHASTDGSENALSPESRHSNGSAIGLGPNGSPVVSFAYGGPGHGGPRMPGGYMMTSSQRMMSPVSATGQPLVAGQTGGWAAGASNGSQGGSYIIQSPTAPLNPIEVFQLSPSVDPYTCLVSGMHGLTLGAGVGGHAAAGAGGPPPGTQFVGAGPLGYPGMCVIGAGAGYASLPNIEAQNTGPPSAASPIDESQVGCGGQQPERGQSN